MRIGSIAKKLACVAIAGATLLVGPSKASAVIMADIVFLIDTSVSMGGDIADVKARIGGFDTEMLANNIDANYGLVRFGGGATFLQDLVDFSTFTAGGSPFDNLTAPHGNPESGSLAVNVAFDNMTFRNGAVKNFILITDEDDDSDGQSNMQMDINLRPVLLEADMRLGANNALFNYIGVTNGNSNFTYGTLAANHGGAFFQILSFRNDPDPFFANFTRTKVREIIDAANNNAVPEPITATLGLMGLGVLGLATRRRTA